MSNHSSSQQKKMSHDDDETTPELDLKLNLSPPGTTATTPSPPQPPLGSPSSSSSVERSGSPSWSCVSRELSPAAEDINAGEVPMMLVGCPRCLMYVMVAETTTPKCPQCNNTDLLDF
ncbi:PREDICTED: uncharacterized protein LOC109191623 [Ipomoea nil]|uniref:uncharacterized protein LOC109191623 n=1 Tax=Ipomoea nil TaxID=35883 RepID=UPI000900DC98|nr:PREDICTED: uncharacterized protein LOC109191623 [Ipomoea nil]